MGRFSPWLYSLLVVLWIYVALGFCIPGALALWPRHEFKDGELVKIRTLGSFSHGSLSIIDYELQPKGESVNEERFFGLSNISVATEQQKDGTLVMVSVGINNRSYEKTLCNHPEVLAEAKKILQLGRDSFAKAKKKLEQKSKPRQPARLG